MDFITQLAVYYILRLFKLIYFCWLNKVSAHEKNQSQKYLLCLLLTAVRNVERYKLLVFLSSKVPYSGEGAPTTCLPENCLKGSGWNWGKHCFPHTQFCCCMVSQPLSNVMFGRSYIRHIGPQVTKNLLVFVSWWCCLCLCHGITHGGPRPKAWLLVCQVLESTETKMKKGQREPPYFCAGVQWCSREHPEETRAYQTSQLLVCSPKLVNPR